MTREKSREASRTIEMSNGKREILIGGGGVVKATLRNVGKVMFALCFALCPEPMAIFENKPFV